MAYSQPDILTTLAYLMGERSVNATTSAPRADFVQQTLHEVQSAHPWRYARTTATLAISNGIATLPTNYDDSQVSQAWIEVGNKVKLDAIDSDDQDEVSSGDRAMWIESIDGEQYKLITKDTDATNITFRYQTTSPTLDSAGNVKTNYPNKMTIALGARRYVKMGQNPDADISQDQKLFEKSLAGDIAAQQVPAPRKRRKTAQSQTGRSTGDF